MKLRFWEVLDTAAHRWHFRDPWGRWICDRYDLALGMTKTELQYRQPPKGSA